MDKTVGRTMEIVDGSMLSLCGRQDSISHNVLIKWFPKTNFPTESSTSSLISLIKIVCGRFCGGVDSLESCNEYSVRDETQDTSICLAGHNVAQVGRNPPSPPPVCCAFNKRKDNEKKMKEGRDASRTAAKSCIVASANADGEEPNRLFQAS